MTIGAEVTMIVTCGAVTMGASAVIETMRGVGCSVALIDIREVVSAR